MAEVRHTTCLACHMQIPHQIYNEIQRCDRSDLLPQLSPDLYIILRNPRPERYRLLSISQQRSAGLWVVYTDGAAKGNPGPSGAGWLIRDPRGEVRSENRKFLGHGTNNEAEYQALTAALEEAWTLGAEAVQVHLDSELLVRQLNGQYRVKSDRLRIFYQQAQDLLRRFQQYVIIHIPREQNQEADRLANLAIRDHFKAASRP